jgi:hypothetical protein
MITMQILGKKQNRCGPVICCEYCKQRIEDAKTAIVLFEHTSQGSPTGHFVIVHKEHSRVFEAENPVPGSWGWMGLNRWLLFLTRNANHDEKAATREVEVFEGLL